MAHVDDALSAEFVTSDLSTGALTNADSLPTAVIRRNGTALVGTDIAVVNKGTGLYVVSVTLASGDGWVVGDYGQIEVSWAMGAVPRAKSFNFAILIKQTADHTAAIAAIPTNPMLATEDGSSFTAIPDMATATALETVDTVVDGIQTDLDNGTDGLTALAALIAALPSQADITGYGGPLDTDAFGRIRSVDGTGTGEFDTLSGTVLLRAATEASIAATEADTNELQGDWMNGGRLDLLIDAINSQTGQMVFSVANKLDTNPTLTAAMCNKLADHSRRRTQANVFASSDGDSISKTSLYGFIQQAQYSNTTDNSGKLTIKNTDASELGQLTLATATADPVTGIGP